MWIFRGVILSAATAALLGLTAFACWAHAQGKGKPPVVESHVLHSIGPGDYAGIIRVGVGDMLQISPFSLPVVPKFLDTSLRVEAREGRVLDLVGQRSSSTTDGRSRQSVFLYVAQTGKTEIVVSLVNVDGSEVRGYRRRYLVEAIQGS